MEKFLASIKTCGVVMLYTWATLTAVNFHIVCLYRKYNWPKSFSTSYCTLYGQKQQFCWLHTWGGSVIVVIFTKFICTAYKLSEYNYTNSASLIVIHNTLQYISSHAVDPICWTNRSLISMNDLNLSVPSQCQEVRKKRPCIFMFPEIIQHVYG